MIISSTGVAACVNAIEVHHIRKLSDLQTDDRSSKPKWMKVMAARQRKSLMVCQDCHQKIHYGRYEGSKHSK